MIELDEFECGMLDAVLEAFGNQNSLTWQQLELIFGDDHELALLLIDALIHHGLVSEAGNVAGGILPLVINRQPQALIFMQSGGFVERYQDDAAALPACSTPPSKSPPK